MAGTDGVAVLRIIVTVAAGHSVLGSQVFL